MHASGELDRPFSSPCWLYFLSFQIILLLRKPQRAKSRIALSLFILS
jgi:hypothetical protein